MLQPPHPPSFPQPPAPIHPTPHPQPYRYPQPQSPTSTVPHPARHAPQRRRHLFRLHTSLIWARSARRAHRTGVLFTPPVLTGPIIFPSQWRTLCFVDRLLGSGSGSNVIPFPLLHHALSAANVYFRFRARERERERERESFLRKGRLGGGGRRERELYYAKTKVSARIPVGQPALWGRERERERERASWGGDKSRII